MAIQSIHDFLLHAPLVAQRSPVVINVLTKEWDFLLNSEAKLIALMANNDLPDDAPGDAEYGWILYKLHQGFAAFPLRALGMPATNITPDMAQSWDRVFTTTGIVMRDGSIISTIKFTAIDIGWANSFVYYLHYRYSGFVPAILSNLKIHPFNQTPQQLSLDGPELKIAIFGDWGTGSWTDSTSNLCPSELVSRAINDQQPDLVIHLGDVYYYGSGGQEQDNLLEDWPAGPQGSFTLNSNHEMYDGANGYFSTALAADVFKIQQNTSYFSITYKDWLIFGLDSAYYTPSTLYAAGTVSDDAQKEFIAGVLALPENADKKIIVLTHHNPIAYDGSSLTQYPDSKNPIGSLMGDVYTALGNRMPDYWYYGHLHNGIVYNSENLTAANPGGIYTPFSSLPNFRCFGHAAIPYGKAYGLDGSTLIDYYTKSPIPDAAPNQVNRVLNGFAMITLQQGAITEQVYEVANGTGADGVDVNLVWGPQPA